MRLVVVLVAAGVLAVPVASAKGSFPSTIALPYRSWITRLLLRQRNPSRCSGSPTRACADECRTPGARARARQGAPGGGHGARVRPWTAVRLERRDWQAFVYDANTGALIREYQLDAAGHVHQRRRRDEHAATSPTRTRPSSSSFRSGTTARCPARGHLALTNEFQLLPLQPERDRRVTRRHDADRGPTTPASSSPSTRTPATPASSTSAVRR